ncbi:hypothetical protein QTP86_006716 [Hemibagrus guttatus]|nr:hypothetical protein QTP86_006716 [Hemibagrus guttatus]
MSVRENYWCSCLTLKVILHYAQESLVVSALVDSRMAVNLIDHHLVEELCLPTLPCETPLRVTTMDNRPIGKGLITQQTILLNLQVGLLHFFVISSLANPIILGFPWLQRHDPPWKEGELTCWSLYCQDNCLRNIFLLSCLATSIESPSTAKNATLPREYHDLRKEFSKERATQLPPHCPWDCTIDLLPNAMQPRCKVFLLSLPETKSMDDYIEEALATGYIPPSTSLAAAGFFFVEKKDGGLRSCIDHRGLTVGYPYPLPLVPAALEQLREARVFSKLDLRSVYNLVWIREGDKWKTAFHTTRGHYKYLVMPYGLTEALAVFQAFINKIFKDIINQYVITYIDDILIYSTSYDDHVHHVQTVLTRLLHHQFYVKAEKCEFHKNSIKFLGYVISQMGVEMDSSKVKAVTDRPEPTTIKELQRFLGFPNFYHQFIRKPH